MSCFALHKLCARLSQGMLKGDAQVKKRMKSKGTNSKQMKTKISSTAVGANQDITGLLTALVQKLTSFETKIDAVLSWISLQSSVAPRQQPLPVPSPERRREPRIMYKVICADCGRDSEVPFKPSGGRPVYCKECFTSRRNKGTFKPRGEGRPNEGAPAPVVTPEKEKPKALKLPRPVKKKKPAAKKKKKKK